MSSYDETPYTSNPFAISTPEHCYTIARLFQLHPKHFAHARVLELGCASGGNIIPLAYRYPDASFVGVDLSKVQIQQGLDQLEALQLGNVELRHMSIMEVDRTMGRFDYIICHGVLSWVDPQVQQRILALCDELLTTDGIAYISYNTYPGWNFMKVVRDMMRFHVNEHDSAADRATQARSVVEFVLDGLHNDDGPYANFLRSEADSLSQQEDYYLLHEHLEDENNPLYFTEFMELAYQHNLQYLGDANVSTMYIGNLPERTAERLQALSDIVQTEQYMDFINNRRFRSSLLCRGNQRIERDLSTLDLRTYCLSTALQLPVDFALESLEGTSAIRFSLGQIHLDVDHPLSKRALYTLRQHFGKPLPFADLSGQISRETHLPKNEVEDHLLHHLNLMRLVLAGVIEIHSDGSGELSEVPRYPTASAVARLQAKTQTYVTTLRHQSVNLSDIERVLLGHLDGSHSIADLVVIVVNLIERGELSIRLNPGARDASARDAGQSPATLGLDEDFERLISDQVERFFYIGLLIA